MSSRGARERGNVTVLMAAAIVLCALLCIAVARLGRAATAKARANTAADAAALAAADALAGGASPAGAMQAAQRTATADGAQLLTCTCVGNEAIVTVARDEARAIARADVSTEPFTISRNAPFAHRLNAAGE